MNNKIEELSRTLLQSGIAASESEAKRMAEEMVGTEQKVQQDFDKKREDATMYGHTPKRPEKNPTDASPVNPEPEVKEEPREAPDMNKAVPSMTPEEYTAMHAKSTEELIQEENLEKEPSKPHVEEEEVVEPVVEEPELEPVQEISPDINIPAPDSEDKAAMLEQMKEEAPEETKPEVSEAPQVEKPEVEETQPSSEATKEELPNLNPLSHESESTQPNENPNLPKVETPDRPEMDTERKKKIDDMEESKVDLSKVFKV